MRQHFETEQDRLRESEVRVKLERIFGCVCMKCPEQYRIDYALVREDMRVERFCEVKVRTRAYDPFWLSLAKWIALMQLGELAPKPSLIAVQWPDLPLQGFTVPRIGSGVPLCWGGRRDQRDDQDREPLVAIPLDRFHPLED